MVIKVKIIFIVLIISLCPVSFLYPHLCPYDWNLRPKEAIEFKDTSILDIIKDINKYVEKETKGKFKGAVIFDFSQAEIAKITDDKKFDVEMDNLIKEYRLAEKKKIDELKGNLAAKKIDLTFPKDFSIACHLLFLSKIANVAVNETEKGAIWSNWPRDIECRVYDVTDKFLTYAENYKEEGFEDKLTHITQSFDRISGLSTHGVSSSCVRYLPEQNKILAIETKSGHERMTFNLIREGMYHLKPESNNIQGAEISSEDVSPIPMEGHSYLILKIRNNREKEKLHISCLQIEELFLKNLTLKIKGHDKAIKGRSWAEGFRNVEMDVTVEPGKERIIVCDLYGNGVSGISEGRIYAFENKKVMHTHVKAVQEKEKAEIVFVNEVNSLTISVDGKAYRVKLNDVEVPEDEIVRKKGLELLRKLLPFDAVVYLDKSANQYGSGWSGGKKKGAGVPRYVYVPVKNKPGEFINLSIFLCSKGIYKNRYSKRFNEELFNARKEAKDQKLGIWSEEYKKRNPEEVKEDDESDEDRDDNLGDLLDLEDLE